MGMTELLAEAERRRGAELSPARLFLEFRYPEVKDLLKHFLTLISGALVFSVSFAEKFGALGGSSLQDRLVPIAAWSVLVLALGACGVGVYTLYLAADRALSAVVDGNESKSGFERLARVSYAFQDIAGLLFGVGLTLLVAAAVLRLRGAA